jgi:hypothetical protein
LEQFEVSQRLHEQEIEQMRAVLAAHDASNPTEQ